MARLIDQVRAFYGRSPPANEYFWHSSEQQMLDYAYANTAPTGAHAYLWPALKRIIQARGWPIPKAFDLGCGNGATCLTLSRMGFDVIGVDLSESGVAQARSSGVNAHIGNAYDDLAATYGTFPLVISLEVIEHCIDPRAFAKTFLALIASDGIGILSTPYNGYLKNVALAVSGNMDRHYTALWDGGHVKFFSVNTLTTLLREAGAANIRFRRVGRIPPLAKSMIAVVATFQTP